ncbi:MAG: zeta toxin family protein [Eubacterium sp.]|nr:zeta toxin family protein [Eubacterium sp.]
MNTYTIIAGVNGVGKSSFLGVLKETDTSLGHMADTVEEIKSCLNMNVSFTQETTLSGHTVLKTVSQARKQGYYIHLYYIGLSNAEESLLRIENRVKKGGHNIPSEDVVRRFNKRFSALTELIPYCDRVDFYDNENGFVKAAEIINNRFRYTSDYNPGWLAELYDMLKNKRK